MGGRLGEAAVEEEGKGEEGRRKEGGGWWRTNRKKILPSTASCRWNLDLLYSNSMCRQSSIPTSILIVLFASGSSDAVNNTRGAAHGVRVGQLVGAG